MSKNRYRPDEEKFAQDRARMVEHQLRGRDIRDAAVLKAMGTVPRHRFVSFKRQDRAYDDTPLPIGYDQTISQPYVVASMTQELQLPRNARVLEIGTGCGYQAAVLAEIAATVYTIEMVPELYETAGRILRDLGYRNIWLREGDGAAGWPDKAPFDGILVTAAAPKMPSLLLSQLKTGGVMIIPLAIDQWGRQFLTKVTKTEAGCREEQLYEVRFVPMVGEIEGE